MGNKKEDPPAKASKSSAEQDEQQPSASRINPVTSIYPDWPTLQDYTPLPPTSSIHSALASSPLPDPYAWGPQYPLPFFHGTPPPHVMYPHGAIYAHPLMAPPYHLPFNGTPPPYAMYPPGEIYAPPLMAHPLPFVYGTPAPYDMHPSGEIYGNPLMDHGAVPDSREVENKIFEDKEKISTKSSKGSLASGNDARSERNSGNEASSEGSDPDSQNGSRQKAGYHQSSSDGTPQKGNPTRMNEPSQPALGYAVTTGPVLALPVPGGVTRRTTNPSPILPVGRDLPSTSFQTPSTSVLAERWIESVKTLKKLRRNEAHKESARRSKIHKKAEWDELIHSVEVLTKENASLRAEIGRLKEDQELLLALNASLLKDRHEETPRDKKGDSSSAADKQQRKPDSSK